MSRLAFCRKSIATSISTAVSLAVAACLITPPALYAQTDVAELHGTVADATGAPMSRRYPPSAAAAAPVAGSSTTPPGGNGLRAENAFGASRWTRFTGAPFASLRACA